MNDQALALLLADALEGRAERAWTRAEVAAELRRLHDHTQMLNNAYRAACEVIRQQETVNAELLAALRWTARALHAEHPAAIKARAAIARAEGEKT